MKQFFVVLFAIFELQLSTPAFEGRLVVALTQGAETNNLLYTAGANYVRIERTETNWPHPVNITRRDSGELTLVYPHNRSFVRFKNGAPGPFPAVPAEASSTLARSTVPLPTAGMNFPSVPPTVAQETFANQPHPPTILPPGVGPQNLRGITPPIVPAVLLMRAPDSAQLELKSTGETTNILGYLCARYELKDRGQTVEIWATDKLLPFQPWLRSQPRRFGPRLIDERWADLLNERKLFPLIASLRFDNDTERFRFEVKSITAEKIRDPDGTLFQPPSGYHEVEPAPF